jgi:hypothetical protein
MCIRGGAMTANCRALWPLDFAWSASPNTIPGMPTRRPSRADRELASGLRAAGYSWVTDTQPQSWRRSGLLPEVVEERGGGERGRRSVYPPGTLNQALALCAMRERHRSTHKIATLLFLRGYPIEASAIRRAVMHWLDRLDSKIARYRRPGIDKEVLARRVARAIVAAPARTERDKQVRKARRDAGADREDEIVAYTRLVLLYVGGTVGPTSVAASVSTLAPTVRSTPNFLSLPTVPGSAMDRDLAEIAARDGLGAAVRKAVPGMRTADFERTREFFHGAFVFAESNGHDLGMPEEGFIRECCDALIAGPAAV